MTLNCEKIRQKIEKPLAGPSFLCHKSRMNEIRVKNPSALVQAVVALDNHFSEINRLGGKIESIELKTDFDFEQLQRFMSLFSQCGEGVSVEVANVSACTVEGIRMTALARAAMYLVIIDCSLN